jgi:hypothetical protein
MAPEALSCLASQFVVEEGRNLPVGVLVACVPGAKEGGHLTG